MPEDEACLGLGFSGFADEESAGYGVIDIYGRMGISPHLDAGIKAFGIPLGFLGGILFDMKYALTPGQRTMAVDFGVSYFGVEDTHVWGFYPAIMYGSRHVYGGVKAVIMGTGGTVELFNETTTISETTTFPGVFFGLAGGRKHRIMLDLNLYRFPENKLVLVPGVALQFQFK